MKENFRFTLRGVRKMLRICSTEVQGSCNTILRNIFKYLARE